jgi:hypothetical protein
MQKLSFGVLLFIFQISLVQSQQIECRPNMELVPDSLRGKVFNKFLVKKNGEYDPDYLEIYSIHQGVKNILFQGQAENMRLRKVKGHHGLYYFEVATDKVCEQNPLGRNLYDLCADQEYAPYAYNFFRIRLDRKGEADYDQYNIYHQIADVRGNVIRPYSKRDFPSLEIATRCNGKLLHTPYSD